MSSWYGRSGSVAPGAAQSTWIIFVSNRLRPLNTIRAAYDFLCSRHSTWLRNVPQTQHVSFGQEWRTACLLISAGEIAFSVKQPCPRFWSSWLPWAVQRPPPIWQSRVVESSSASSLEPPRRPSSRRFPRRKRHLFRAPLRKRRTRPQSPILRETSSFSRNCRNFWNGGDAKKIRDDATLPSSSATVNAGRSGSGRAKYH